MRKIKLVPNSLYDAPSVTKEDLARAFGNIEMELRIAQKQLEQIEGQAEQYIGYQNEHIYRNAVKKQKTLIARLKRDKREVEKALKTRNPKSELTDKQRLVMRWIHRSINGLRVTDVDNKTANALLKRGYIYRKDSKYFITEQGYALMHKLGMYL